MFTIRDFSSIACYVYRSMANITKYFPNEIYKRKQYYAHAFMKIMQTTGGIFEVILDDYIQDAHNTGNEFYGSIFVKVQHHRATSVMVGIRGTANMESNYLADIHSWWKSAVLGSDASVNSPKFFVHQAARLCNLALKFAWDELNLASANVFVTGHSLGGAVAALMPAKLRLPVRAVTFNAPGIKEIPGVADFWDRIINIRADYDFVSAIGHPIGPTWNVFLPENAERAKVLYEEKHLVLQSTQDMGSLSNPLADINLYEDGLAILDQHKMINLWRALNKNHVDAQTYASFEGFLAFLRRRYQQSIST